MEVPPASPEALARLTELEATVRDLLGEPSLAPRGGRGRPWTLPAAVLWSGLLVCVLRGFQQPADLYRLLCVHGFWRMPRYDLTDAAIYHRLETAKPDALAPLLTQVTQAVHERWPTLSCCALAPFATAILAVDHTILDAVLRRRHLLRELPNGDRCLLPGALGCLFDVRRQLWVRLQYLADPQQDLRQDVRSLVAGLAKGTLLLFDLGYFAFWFFDDLTEAGYHFVTRWRQKVTYTVEHCFYEGGSATVRLWDGLIYPGQHRADRAAHPVRMIRIERLVGSRWETYQYVTNVLDPRLLPAWQVAALYQRRWDIEQAFNLVKTHLGLRLLWSSHPKVILHQIYATFILCQVVLSLRNEVAERAQVDLREVSLVLLLRWLPQLAADFPDPIGEFVRGGRRAGYLRPVRGKSWDVPAVDERDYVWPAHPPEPRPARYGSRDYCQRTYQPNADKAARRARYWPDAKDCRL